jgi:hypothetical protein
MDELTIFFGPVTAPTWLQSLFYGACMSEQIKPEQVNTDTGIELDKVTFDADGKVEGLDEETLDSVAGGLMMEPGNNNGCGNNVSC